MTGRNAPSGRNAPAGGVRRARAERGSAVVEFVVLGVLLLVPVVYLVATLAQIQAAAFAMEAGAREAGRVLATSDSAQAAHARAQAALDLAAQDQHLPEPAHLALECESTPCLSPGARVGITAWTAVPLPLVPDAVARGLGAHVRVDAQHEVRIDEYAVLGQ